MWHKSKPHFLFKLWDYSYLTSLYSFGYFTGTQAFCTNVHSFCNAINFNLYISDIRFPDSVASSVRMTYLYTKMLTFITYIALGHLLHLPAIHTYEWTNLISESSQQKPFYHNISYISNYFYKLILSILNKILFSLS